MIFKTNLIHGISENREDFDFESYHSFLTKIGYLEPEVEDFKLNLNHTALLLNAPLFAGVPMGITIFCSSFLAFLSYFGLVRKASLRIQLSNDQCSVKKPSI
jgi:hypothetical protein